MATSTRKKTTRRPKASRSADRPDKNLEAFRDALEKSITLPRERIQEVVDDAVKRGRMTRDDANEIVSKLVSRGRRQTEDLIKELEKVLDNARGEVEGRTARARKTVEKRTTKARKRAERVAKSARDAADEPLAQADKLRRRAGVGSDFPITGYDELTAAQVGSRLGNLTKPELRKVRTYEKNGKARKGILDKIEAKLSWAQRGRRRRAAPGRLAPFHASGGFRAMRDADAVESPERAPGARLQAWAG